jgi:uncharacterized protein YdhG (YjbR/CyaY superfamily)
LVAKNSAGRNVLRSKKQFETMDEFIRASPKDVQGVLEKIRQSIRKVAPEAEESISYRMPAFKLKGRVLVYFAAFRKHIGLFLPAPRDFKKEVSKYEGPKGNLKFPTDEPIPYDLITRIVLFRKKAILDRKK